MQKILLSLLVVLSLSLSSCSVESLKKSKEVPVRNIIFLIGDGMGVAQVSAAMEYSKDSLNMEKANTAGFSTTHSLTSKITDSAAAGTALATGNKTRNGIISQDTLGNEFKSILKIAEENGLATGLVSTSAITHATPASFIANESSRGNYEAIAADFLKTEIDLFIGGGYNHFAVRKDSLNYIDSLKAKDYTVLKSMDEIMSFESGKLAGLISDEHPPKYSEGRGDMLPNATKKAIELLSANEKGFFLMVEGSQIDWGGHANDPDFVLQETLDFDRAIGAAIEFQKNNPNTLIVVTSDHETGGVTLPSPDGDYSNSTIRFSTGGHTSVMVPVFAYGNGAEEFSGIFDNTEFISKFLKLYLFE
jgi:alkaline phosphatase